MLYGYFKMVSNELCTYISKIHLRYHNFSYYRSLLHMSDITFLILGEDKSEFKRSKISVAKYCHNFAWFLAHKISDGIFKRRKTTKKTR